MSWVTWALTIGVGLILLLSIVASITRIVARTYFAEKRAHLQRLLGNEPENTNPKQGDL
jgi:hypothetical protein